MTYNEKFIHATVNRYPVSIHEDQLTPRPHSKAPKGGIYLLQDIDHDLEPPHSHLRSPTKFMKKGQNTERS
jgi:hypothetical protein